MRFGHPLSLWLLLLVPLLAAFLAWGMAARRRAIARFAEAETAARLIVGPGVGRRWGSAALLLAGCLFLVLSLAGPQFGARLSLAQRRGVDVFVVLDVSRSMLAQDVKPSRLERARHQVRELMDRLQGDRVGLVVFAAEAFVQCPLTLDYGAVDLLLDSADPGVVSAQGTAVARAVRTALSSFGQGEGKHKVIVVFTDGEDHEGDPVAAAREAAQAGVRLFAVGLGTPGGELVPAPSQDGTTSFHRDREGNYVKTRLDEATLKEMALVTDGGYYRSTASGAEMATLAQQIAGMEGKDLGSTRFTQYEERFQIPLALALVCLLGQALLADGGRPARRSGARVLLCGLVSLLHVGATVGDGVASRAEEARERYAQGDYEGALRLYRDALVERPTSPQLHFNVGDALYKTGDHAQALKEFEQALAAEGGTLQPQAYYNMGNAFYQQQQYGQAVDAYRRALELAPSDR
ncbi:MAG: VWA domain-containing protein, partial [Candidatus Latescibacterota bacterium]